MLQPRTASFPLPAVKSSGSSCPEWQWLRVLEQEVREGALRQHHPSQSHADSGGSSLTARLSLIPASSAEEGRKSLVVFTHGQ